MAVQCGAGGQPKLDLLRTNRYKVFVLLLPEMMV
jgi:hypothetical protein